MRFRHLDERIHADEFIASVSLRPGLFLSFVEDSFVKAQVVIVSTSISSKQLFISGCVLPPVN